MTEARRKDLARFIDKLRAAAMDYEFGIECRTGDVEIYDRREAHELGPVAEITVDSYEVRR